MNKVTRIGAIVLVTVFAISGCSANISPWIGSSPQVSQTQDQRYIAAVHTAAPDLIGTADQVLIGSGRGSCKAMNDGHTAAELSARAVQYGLSQVDGDAIILSAISVYCPTFTGSPLHG